LGFGVWSLELAADSKMLPDCAEAFRENQLSHLIRAALKYAKSFTPFIDEDFFERNDLF
jgi:hypothetical protein